jgi:hypothetical protein
MAKSNVKTIVCTLFFSFSQSSNLVTVSSTEYTSIIQEEYNKKLIELGDEADDPIA